MEDQVVEELNRAEEKLRSALESLKSREDSISKRIRDLTVEIEKNSSPVAKNKAKQELAVLQSSNPLPLRKERLSIEAALRKIEKQVRIFFQIFSNGVSEKEPPRDQEKEWK